MPIIIVDLYFPRLPSSGQSKILPQKQCQITSFELIWHFTFLIILGAKLPIDPLKNRPLSHKIKIRLKFTICGIVH